MRGLYPLVLTAVVVVLFAPFWMQGRAFVPGDFLTTLYPWRADGVKVQNPEPFDVAVFFYPQDVLLNKELKQGRLPLWNPAIFAGHPWIASGQSAQLYPPRLLLHWLFTPATARTLDLMVHLLAMGLCTYWFLRVRGFEPPAAGMGGLVFMLNAFMATWLEFEHVLIVGTFTALMLLAVEKRNPLMLAICGGLALHAGHIQFCLYVGPLVAAYAMMRRKVDLGMTVGAALAVVLSFPITLPFLQLQSLCQRPQLPLQDMAASLPSYLPTLLSPTFWGRPQELLLDRVPAHLIFSEFACYIGFIPLLLALSAVGRKSSAMERRETFFWAAIAVGALWAASATFPYPLLAQGFLGRLIPGRVLIVFVLAGAMLAAQGCQGLDLKRVRALGVTLLAVWIALVAWLLHNPPGNVKLPPPDTPGLQEQIPALLSHTLLTDPQTYIPLLAVGLLFLFPRKIALVIFTAIDLSILAVGYNPTSADLYPETPALKVVQNQPGRTEKTRAAFYNTLTPYGARLVGGYESLFPVRYYRLLWTVQPDAPPPIRSLALQTFDHPILDALGLTWLVAFPGTEAPGPAWQQVYTGPDATVFRNTRAMPRAWVVGEVQPFTGYEQLRSFEPARTATVEGALEPVRPGPASVTLTTETTDSVELTAQLDQPGLLVLADQFYPGWEATVDGQPKPIVCADGALRGVFLPAGRHEVRFVFRPAPFRTGVRLALGALALLLVWAGVRRWRAPSRAANPASPG